MVLTNNAVPRNCHRYRSPDVPTSGLTYLGTITQQKPRHHRTSATMAPQSHHGTSDLSENARRCSRASALCVLLRSQTPIQKARVRRKRTVVPRGNKRTSFALVEWPLIVTVTRYAPRPNTNKPKARSGITSDPLRGSYVRRSAAATWQQSQPQARTLAELHDAGHATAASPGQQSAPAHQHQEPPAASPGPGQPA